ncbi:MAG: deoxyribodipyrimidine photo-lyase [Pedobacter sp.]|nr:MAG: deoxyribodipyrimidine photo-lyase [Pedobacter sp.]
MFLEFFIFDENILNKLSSKTDARVSFIHDTLRELKHSLESKGSSLLVQYGKPYYVWSDLLTTYNVKAVYTNEDYEPYARERDSKIGELLKERQVSFSTFKDHVIFSKDEIVKPDGKPYTVFTPYYKTWLKKLNDFYLSSYPVEKYFKNLIKVKPLDFPSLEELGFERTEITFPSINFEVRLEDYEEKRDYPAADATTHIGLHLRFGTLSVRAAARTAQEQKAHKWLSELAWRDFYAMILWHFPHSADNSFKSAYDNIKWQNNEEEFKLWCEGKTGYPLVDAGMRQLNATGFMHNRVRMVVASFLCKHLLIDWRWGEAYFAEKLLDYDLASNVGGWQWACGSGNDAAPYFRIFNPELQLKKFDPKMEYVFEWAPEYKFALLPIPIVEHTFARDRALKTYKQGLA